MSSTRLRPALVLAAGLLLGSGAVSAQGAVRGLSSVTSRPFTVAAGTQARGSVQCPGQKVPLGGGAFISGSTVTIGLASSFPTARGWTVDVGNPTAASTTFRLRVICAAKPKHYALSVGLFASLAVGRSVPAFAACPTGSLPLGGGADTSASVPLVNLAGSFPTNQAWAVSEFNGSTLDAAVASVTTCGTLKGYVVAPDGPLTLGPHLETRITAPCPHGLIAVGGGVTGAPTSAITVNTSAPNNAFSDPTRPFDIWDTEVNNTSAAPATATAWAVCVHP